MTTPAGPGYSEPFTEEGWVDALCSCGDSDSHAGLFCPSRAPEELVVDRVDHDAEVAAAQAALSEAQSRLDEAERAAKGGN